MARSSDIFEEIQKTESGKKDSRIREKVIIVAAYLAYTEKIYLDGWLIYKVILYYCSNVRLVACPIVVYVVMDYFS